VDVTAAHTCGAACYARAIRAANKSDESDGTPIALRATAGWDLWEGPPQNGAVLCGETG